jgi:hypothetical protein
VKWIEKVIFNTEMILQAEGCLFLSLQKKYYTKGRFPVARISAYFHLRARLLMRSRDIQLKGRRVYEKSQENP